MRAEIKGFRSHEEMAKAELEELSLFKRAFANLLLLGMPNYRYDRSRLPPLDPPPKPGLPSTVAAAKAIGRLI